MKRKNKKKKMKMKMKMIQKHLNPKNKKINLLIKKKKKTLKSLKIPKMMIKNLKHFLNLKKLLSKNNKPKNN
jgi:ribosomal protein L13E